MVLASGLAEAQPAYRLSDLGHLGGGYATGADLNDAGQVTGWSGTSDFDTHAFLWDDTADPNSESYEDDTAARRTQYCYQVKVVSPSLPGTPSNVAQAKTR
jgi:probable HAF family extracellular repeat protein